MSNIPYIIKSNGSVTLYIEGKSETVGSDHKNYSKIIDALKNAQWSLIPALIDTYKEVKSYINNAATNVKIEHGVVTYKGTAVHNTLTKRIIQMMTEGYKFDHMARFLENLMENPSSRAVRELYTFLENYGLPITEDGHFLAYKAVKNDYFDIYTGKTHKNTVGSVQEMARNLVDDDWGKDCSQGLHCGALDYVVGYGHFSKGAPVPAGGNRLVILKVHPRDVVSVPNYAKFTKMRVCKYTVLNEVTDVVAELSKIVYTAAGQELNPDVWKKPVEPKVEATKTEKPKAAVVKNADGIDITSEWNEEAYREGYSIGLSDRVEGYDYGTSRDYDRENSYRIGYNDAFNGRINQATLEDPNDTDSDSDDDCCGDCGCCGCGSDDDEGCPTTEDREYSTGYEAGKDDATNNKSYQASLSIDASDSFKSGYRAGYNKIKFNT